MKDEVLSGDSDAGSKVYIYIIVEQLSDLRKSDLIAIRVNNINFYRRLVNRGKSVPQSKNAVGLCAFQIISTFFYLGIFLQKLADNQCSSITKGSIYRIKQNFRTTFCNWSELNLNNLISFFHT